jgi:Zn-dependent protease
MFRSWKVGSVAGIGIFVHWTFWLLPIWVGYEALPQGRAEAVMAVALVLTLFACVLLHELGHAFMARVFGIDTRDITLYPIGGAARLERMSERPSEELLIALAGPAVNVAIAVALGLIAAVGRVPVWPSFIGHGPWLEVFLIRLLVMNIFLVIFNLLPVFPMDGGRVFRAFLSMFLDRLWATRVAVGVTLPMAALFVIGAYLERTPLLAVIAVLVVLMGQAELAVVRYQEAKRRAEADAAYDEGPPEVYPAETVVHPSAIPAEPGFSGFTWDREAGLWIEWRAGRPVCAVPAGPRG